MDASSKDQIRDFFSSQSELVINKFEGNMQ